MYASTHTLGNIIGPTYGAAWCDRALKIDRALHTLAIGIEDEAYDAGVRIERPDDLPFLSPAQARNELDGSFPSDTPVKGRRWPPLTAREHHALGSRLKDARDRASGLFVTFSGAFPQTSPRKLAGRAKKVEKIITSIRDYLDNMAHIDCPAHRDCSWDHDGIGPARLWYYGTRDAR
jgi:hypothetical protein